MENSYTRYKIQDTRYKLKAQSLLEALLSITLGVILIGGSVGLMGISLRTFNTAKQHLQANSLMRQTAEIIQSLARDNWHNIYDLTKSTATSTTDYKITTSSLPWLIEEEPEELTVNGIPYKRYFRVYNVTRDGNGKIFTSGTDDPSTQKITIFLEYGNNYVSSSTLSFYLTRSYNNQVFHQADQKGWSGGSGQTGPVPNPGNKFATSTNIYYASTTGQITLATTTSAGELTSSILDTGVSGGAGFNSLLWQGSLGTSGAVKFQIAFSNSSSTVNTFYGCTNCDPASCLTSNYYQPNPNVSCRFPTTDTASPQNKRYIRYKVYLSTASTTPQIDDIIINWTP